MLSGLVGESCGRDAAHVEQVLLFLYCEAGRITFMKYGIHLCTEIPRLLLGSVLYKILLFRDST